MEIWEILVISIIGASAAGYLAWILFGKNREKSICSSCPHSGSCKGPAPK